MMKNVFVFVFGWLMLLPVALRAEETLESTAASGLDSGSRIVVNGASYDFIFSWNREDVKSHWTGFGFSFNNLTGLGDVGLNLTRSYSLALNVGNCILPLDRHWLLASGLGFDWSRFHFRGNYALQSVRGKTYFLSDSDGYDYRDSRLLVYYATIPFLLEYQTGRNGGNLFFVYGGVEGLVKLYSKSQAEVRTPSLIRKDTYRSLNLLPMNARITARIGFKDFSLFGHYHLFSLFEYGKGPDIHPYALGLMLNF
jgi:hypothetical protein